MCPGSACRTRDDVASSFCDDSCENKYQDRDDDLRQVEKDHLLKKDRYAIEAENIERSDQEDDHYEPLDHRAQKGSNVQVDACLACRFVHTGCLQGVVD